MKEKIIIGILGRCNDNQIYVNDDYRLAIINSGAIPFLILPPYINQISKQVPFSDDLRKKEKEDIKFIIDQCDGILMPGGIQWYGFDQFIFQYAKEQNIPILGICLGMQLIANEPYFREENSDHTVSILSDDHYSLSAYVHPILIMDGLLKNILETDFILVNSRHHTKIKKNQSFQVSSYSSDGVIESIEIPEKDFILGVQWHPESLFLKDVYAAKLFQAFIDACKKRKPL